MTDYSGLISAGNVNLQPEILGGIFAAAAEQSSVLGLARKLRNMTTNEMKLLVSTALPEVYFVGEKGRKYHGSPQTFPADALKKVTTSEWDDVKIYAGELAAIIVVPNSVFQDANFDILGECRAQFPSAIAAKVDAAVLYGNPATDVPDDWPDGLFTQIGSNIVESGGSGDTYDDLLGESGVFAKVEGWGYDVNGVIADISMKAKLRGLRDESGSGMPIFLPSMQSAGNFVLSGVPMRFPLNGAFDKTKTLLIAGDWNKLVYSIRQDVAIDVFTTGVVSDGDGAVVHNLMQEDLTALRCTFRMGWALPVPYQRYSQSADAFPFAAYVPPASS